MEIVLWVVLGSLAGALITSLIKEGTPFIRFTDMLLGSLGAVFGGLLAQRIIPFDRIGLYDETILIAVVAAGALIWVGRILIPKKSYS